MLTLVMDFENTTPSEVLKPAALYHASGNRDIEEFEPRNRHTRDRSEGPVVFGTPDKAVASMFLVHDDDRWSEKGLHNGVPLIRLRNHQTMV